MKISGIICEYNPFHNGHLYHIEKTRENGATHIAAVMSGNFVQRGEPAASDKFRRAQAAVRSGADLVIELPTPCVLSSAEGYARGAVHILNSLGCVEEISFGSECGDVQTLFKLSEAVNGFSGSEHAKALIASGLSYPLALAKYTEEKYGKDISSALSKPNNILAAEYIRALEFFDSKIRPFTVRRKISGHDSDIVADGFASASHIRELISRGEDVSCLVPRESLTLLENTASLKNLERVILYLLRTADTSTIAALPDVGQGLEYRIKKAAAEISLDGVLQKIKSKRYTMARIKRILLCLVIGITAKDAKALPPYGRILAMNSRGCEILSLAKKHGKLPLSVSPARLSEKSRECRRFVEIESRAADVYALAADEIMPSGMDFTAKAGVIK